MPSPFPDEALPGDERIEVSDAGFCWPCGGRLRAVGKPRRRRLNSSRLGTQARVAYPRGEGKSQTEAPMPPYSKV